MNQITVAVVPMIVSYIVSFALAIFVFGQNPKDGLHRIFSVRCMLITFWAFLDFVIEMTKDHDLRLFWAKSGFFWPIYIAVLLHFSLACTEGTSSRFGRISLGIAYTSGAAFSLGELVLNFNNSGSLSQLHWLTHYMVPAWSMFYGIENVWMVCIVSWTVFIQTRYFVTLRDRAKEKKARYIFSGYIISTILSAIVLGLSGAIGPRYMYLAHFIPIVGNLIITLGIVRHALFIINPAMASEHIISTMTDALFLIDTRQRVIETNRAAETLTGYKGNVLRDSLMSSFFVDKHGFSEIEEDIFAGEKIESVDLKLVRMDNSILDVSFSASVLRSKTNETIGAVCLIRDVSDRVRLLNEKANMDERLVQFQKMQAIGQLASGIAHDFNNCLSAILLSAQELRDRYKGMDGELADLADNILDASKYGRDITEKLLSFARKEQGTRETVDVYTIIDRVVSFLVHTVDKGITIRKDLADIPSILFGNALELQNAFINIALNGCDAMQEKGGELIFRTGIINIQNTELYSPQGRIKTGRYLSIGIIDNGVGMDEDVKKRMFEPFFTTKPAGKGTGLGLSSVYGIVRNHEGIIDVASIVNRGTTFTIYLPLITNHRSSDFRPTT